MLYRLCYEALPEAGQVKISYTFILYLQFTHDLYHICLMSFSSYNGYKLKSHRTCFQRGFIVQSVELAPVWRRSWVRILLEPQLLHNCEDLFLLCSLSAVHSYDLYHIYTLQEKQSESQKILRKFCGKYFNHHISRKILHKYCIFRAAYAFCLNICVHVCIYQSPMPTCLFVYKILSICMLKVHYIIARKSILVRLSLTL